MSSETQGERPENLCEPVLLAAGVAHGFGRRGSQAPDSTLFPRQVHGVTVLDGDRAGSVSAAATVEADAIVSASPGTSVGVVTADCVPILAATRDGRTVVAIHAGWRGLAAGVVEAGIAALRSRSRRASGPRSGAPTEITAELVCGVGPAARGCCYEVDEPVRAGLERRYGAHLDEALQPGRAGHYQLDLPLLATRVLEDVIGPGSPIGVEQRLCTICDASRFESFRRDGAAAGRLRHFIRVGGPPSGEG